MAMTITIAESQDTLSTLARQCPVHLRPRIKMLQLLLKDNWLSNAVLAAKTGASERTIARWIKVYTSEGIEALVKETRGGDRKSGFSQDDLGKIRQRLSEPGNTFTTYIQAKDWINAEFGTNKSYSALNQFLKRQFGTKLKVGRKSHVKKDEAAVAVFKKPIRDD